MSAYTIKRWNAVTENNILKRPMIYIEPDPTFLTFVRANNFAVLCEISGTGMNYDSVQIPGVVSRSSLVPNCRPNFFEATGYYTVTLLAPWIGYPKNLGQVKFFGLEAGMPAQISAPKKDVKKSKVVEKIPVKTKTSNKEEEMSKKKKIIIGTSIGVLLIIAIVVLYLIFKR
jgi:hypothetical protein